MHNHIETELNKYKTKKYIKFQLTIEDELDKHPRLPFDEVKRRNIFKFKLIVVPTNELLYNETNINGNLLVGDCWRMIQICN